MSDGNQIFLDSLKNFLSPIAALLEDETVTEIMVNGPNEIWIERAGRVERSDAKFEDEDALRSAVNNIAQSVGRVINYENSTLDARLPNGYRIHVVIPPCARGGTTMAIRKFFKTQMTFQDYISRGAMSMDVAQFLDICMKLGKNVIVSGGTGSGKTTLLGVLCSCIPKGQRIIVIEDSSELSVDYEHVVFFETRHADEQGLGEVSIRDLVKSSLRLRPDRIILGEVRSGEAFELVQAMNTGHKGCMGTIHANTAQDALLRLESLAIEGNPQVNVNSLKKQISSAVDIIVQVARCHDGGRRLYEIAEVSGLNERGDYISKNIYTLVESQEGFEIVATGEVPSLIEEIESREIPFSRNKFAA